ncbi:hypothetical protein CHU98_g7300 [Xylaria longipes]|nr:hypothetical protein CHU98_g7300 [Xylaria longipes]
MITIPRKQAGPKPSKYVPESLERQLRTQVLDSVDDRALGGKNEPQLIIGNVASGCHGTYTQHFDGVEFIFHHSKMTYATTCKCVSQTAAGEATFQIPKALDDHRVRLILGTYNDVPWPLEPKLAAIVAMKIFLGMDVPAPLGVKHPAGDTELAREEVPNPLT